MMELREKYGDDKVRMNQELMNLYKTEKVNPVSGCLPIVVQIPVFFSLYKVLFVTIEMRHAPFFGWIHDLSAPDPTSVFNLFGLIPITLPHMLMIGVWPLIMGCTMWLQTKLNPAPTDPTQAKVMQFLPLMFIFLFATLPGRPRDLLELEQLALDRAAVGDHEADGREGELTARRRRGGGLTFRGGGRSFGLVVRPVGSWVQLQRSGLQPREALLWEPSRSYGPTLRPGICGAPRPFSPPSQPAAPIVIP